MRRILGLAAFAALALVLATQQAWSQAPPPRHPVFGHSLYSGTGFIHTPDAFVTEGWLWGTFSMISVDNKGVSGLPSENSRLSGGVGLAGWVEVGAMATSRDHFAAFGKVQLVRQQGIFPAIGAGVLNLTNSDMGRFALYDTAYATFGKRTSFYAVMSYVVGPGGRSFPSWVVLSFGWGSGVFLEDQEWFEGDEATGGAFGAVAFDFGAADDAFIRVTTEWDGFDLNLAISAWLAGLEMTVGVLSLDEGEAPEPLAPGEAYDPTRTRQGIFYNQAKAYVSMTLDARVLGRLPWIWKGDEE